MKIQSVRIRNFRTLKDVTIPFDSVTTFIGPNGAGVFQGSCRVDRVFYAASSSAGCSRSGLSMTAPMGSQLRVLP
ncbi:AAA family ATPase, partial [Pseudomonas aeruginosa]